MCLIHLDLLVIVCGTANCTVVMACVSGCGKIVMLTVLVVAGVRE